MSLRVICPTCHGHKTIDDPTRRGPMSYYNPATGDSWPQILCESCGGTGWVIEQSNLLRPGS